MAEENNESVENTENQEAKNQDQVEANTEKVVENTSAVEETVEASSEIAVEEMDAVKNATEEIQSEKKEYVAPLYANPSLESFDWDTVEKDIEEYTPEERETLNSTYQGTLSSIEEKQVVEGTVLEVGKKEIIVNIGYKSEGIISANEFRYNPELKAGDLVPIYIHQKEDKNGQLVISHKTARVHSAWKKVNEVLETGEIITGFVKCRTKGGLIVDVFGLEAFLPGSQIDVKPIRDYDIYVGREMEFKVVKINAEFKNVVVSHKALIEAELEEQKKVIMAGLEKGQVLEGVVKNITSYGVFVDLGGVDGLVHITDLSWGRINHPEEMVELDQKINVVILDFDDEKKRIALGIKQLTSHPWDALDENLNIGDQIKGKVVVMADYGAFVEIAAGVEGLIHVSEMSWSQHLRTAQDFLKIGDEVNAVVLTLDREERKMSLGIKQLVPDPWEGIVDRYPVGSTHKSKVRNFTNFGVFVEMEEGIDGLIHISDLSWAKRIKHPSEFCNVGDELEVKVLEVDKESRRLSLGHKQMEENPWDVFETVFEEGSIHQGTIIRKEGSQFVVSLPYGVEGFATVKHLNKEDGSTAKLEESIDFKVLEFNKNGKRIVVSHSKTWDGTSIEKVKGKTTGGAGSKGVKNVQNKIEKTTLGDLDILSNLKDSMEKGE